MAEIDSGKRTLEAKLAEINPTAERAANQWWVPPPMGETIIWIGQKTVEIGKEILEFIADLLRGVVAPIIMFYDAYRWTDIKGPVNGLATDINAQNLVAGDSDWSSDGHEAYVVVAQAQATAATRIGSIAGNTSNALLLCAAAGLAFYVVLAGIIAKLIIACTAATEAIASVVFSEIGAMIFVEEGAVNTIAITTAVSTLGAFLVAQVNSLVTTRGDAVDPSGFPGGLWPKANSERFSDATVADGDADWSLKDE